MSRRATTLRWKTARCIFILSMWISGVCMVAYAQYPGQIKKDADTTPTLRATGVFEWTGDLEKPKAGRLIPLTVWDGQQYQPGGLYMAQPAPLTVLTGTVYELEQAGTPKGLFNVNGAQNLSGSWIAIGSVKPEVVIAKPKPPMSKHPPQVVHDVDSDKPTLHRKDGSGDSDESANSSSTPDPDRPTLHKKDSTNSSSGSGTSSGNTQASGSSSGGSSPSSSDPDRPTLHKRDSSNSGSGSDSGGSSGDSTTSQNSPSVDSDRPTLHRKDSDDSAGGGQNPPSVDPDRPTLHKSKDDAGAYTGAPVTAMANADSGRPTLRYGKPEAPEGIVEPSKLEGLPMDMNQIAAISDVKKRELHPYTYSWADPEDAAKMKAAMEELAQKAIAGSAANPTTQPTAAKAGSKTSATTRRKAPPAPPLPALEDEKFGAFELSYNGGATLVFTAKSTAEDRTVKFVTLIAQPDFYGTPQVIFKQITTDRWLDIAPRMRLVDAADTDADGRAELIFELRGKSERQFGIYRIVNRRVIQAYNTGPLP